MRFFSDFFSKEMFGYGLMCVSSIWEVFFNAQSVFECHHTPGLFLDVGVFKERLNFFLHESVQVDWT